MTPEEREKAIKRKPWKFCRKYKCDIKLPPALTGLSTPTRRLNSYLRRTDDDCIFIQLWTLRQTATRWQPLPVLEARQ